MRKNRYKIFLLFSFFIVGGFAGKSYAQIVDSLNLSSDEAVVSQSSLSISAQDSLTQVVNDLRHELSGLKKKQSQVIIKKEHDTVYVNTDSCLEKTLSARFKYNDSILESICHQISDLKVDPSDGRTSFADSKSFLWLLSIFALMFGIMLWWLYKSFQRNKHLLEAVRDDIRNVADDLPNRLTKLNSQIELIRSSIDNISGTTKNGDPESKDDDEGLPKPPIKPTLDAYNHSVHEFQTINDQIYSLRGNETRNLLHSMFQLLALEVKDDSHIKQQIREMNISENRKEQFVSLVSQIQSFLKQRKPIIDAWLYNDSRDNVKDYLTGLRLPIGELFDEDLDRDVLGEASTGQMIKFVQRMGYYFPGNTVAAYREKSIVIV
jgi:hypothetical protein